MLTIQEIKNALDAGKRVISADYGYEVIKDCKGQYLIKAMYNSHYIGLHGAEGTKYENIPNYTESDGYYIGQCSECYYAKYSKNIICSNMDCNNYMQEVKNSDFCDKFIK
jgi:hypothetical protein